MTKAELIEQMAKDAKISKVAAAAALESFMANVTKALKKKDGKVTLVGFGTFAKIRRKARKGRNPQTGEPIKIKGRNTVIFKAGKNLKMEAISGKKSGWATGSKELLFSHDVLKIEEI